ncbi:MAG: signal recognition particle-docking protein FtsY [Candidatus Riflebacteria bacterium]|nr:signal recognition particle-docking protein FtsY [Candidatus Riflebacteria bacterium]
MSKNETNLQDSTNQQLNQSQKQQITDKLNENKQPGKVWDESRLIVLLIGISLMAEGALIHYQAGDSQFLVAVVTGVAGLLMTLMAYFLPFEQEPEDEQESEDKQKPSELKPVEPKVEEITQEKTAEPEPQVTEKILEQEVEKPVEKPVETVAEEPELSWFERLTKGLTKTRTGFIGKLKKLVLGSTKIDSDLLEELEEALYEADVGVKTTGELLSFLHEKVEKENITDPNQIYALLKDNLKNRLNKYAAPPTLSPDGLTVYLIIGVNGVGKTTTIAKLANYFTNAGKKVVLAAGDTFRAAAIDQICIWGERAKVDVIHGNEGGDPGALVFDAIHAAKKREADLLIIDTAGRMHVKANLMSELKKIQKIAEKESCGGPHEILLVLDATTGQNAVQQAKQFNEALPITGLVVTKLDGTAKGGVLFAVEEQISAPVKFIGVGEKMNDLMPFEPTEYLQALFADDSDKKKESDYNVVK